MVHTVQWYTQYNGMSIRPAESIFGGQEENFPNWSEGFGQGLSMQSDLSQYFAQIH